jgi:hypothetical protein
MLVTVTGQGGRKYLWLQTMDLGTGTTFRELAERWTQMDGPNRLSLMS